MANAIREPQLVSEDLMYNPDLMAQDDLRVARNTRLQSDLRSSTRLANVNRPYIAGRPSMLITEDALQDSILPEALALGALEAAAAEVEEEENDEDEDGEEYNDDGEAEYEEFEGDDDYYDRWQSAMADRDDFDEEDIEEDDDLSDTYLDENGNLVDEYGEPIEEDLNDTSAGIGTSLDSFAAQQGTGKLLAAAWLNLIDTFGLTLIWINIHAFINFSFGDRWFCNLGDEWLAKMPKGSKGVFKQIKQASGVLGLIETIGLILLDLLVLILVLAIIVLFFVVCYYILNPLEAAWEAITSLF